MKPIEEKATHHAMVIKEDGSIAYNVGKYISFQRGAEWMREEMTRWHDPIEESPEPYKVVEVKYRSSGMIRISTAWIYDSGSVWTIDGTNRTINRTKVIGWREIHE